MYGILCDLDEEGMKSSLATFIESSIVERSIRVRVGSTLYDVFAQAQGIPQGASCPQHCLKLKSITYELFRPQTDVDDFCMCYRSYQVCEQLKGNSNSLSLGKTLGLYIMVLNFPCQKFNVHDDPELYI